MLISGDQVVVIGYSYARAGSEVIRFTLSEDGRLTHRDTHRIDAADYFSADNYASRLIGDELILYNARPVRADMNPAEVLPAVISDSAQPVRRAIAGAQDLFRVPDMRPSDLSQDTLHSITRCDLSAPRFDCKATVVLGGWAHSFYVAPDAVYLSVGESGRSMLYRMPLDAGRPRALRISGMPLDQFSFRQAGDRLHVVLQSEGRGDWMWSRDRSGGDTDLLTVPLASFTDGSRAASLSAYRRLPAVDPDSWQRRNRFVGDHLLYAAGGDYGGKAKLVVGNVNGGEFTAFTLDGAASRIEAMGRDGLVVTSGLDGSRLVAVRLGDRPAPGQPFALAGGGEAERRSHGFFFRPDRGRDSQGVLALPLARRGVAGTDMAFIRRDEGGFARLGVLGSRLGEVEDGCRASCADWYGQSRPIFLRDRTFALMGYEIVEGRLEGGRIREIGRLDFTPARRARAAG